MAPLKPPRLLSKLELRTCWANCCRLRLDGVSAMSAVMSKRTVCFFSLLVSRFDVSFVFVVSEVFRELLTGVVSRLELDLGLFSVEEEDVEDEDVLEEEVMILDRWSGAAAAAGIEAEMNSSRLLLRAADGGAAGTEEEE